ncbi:uncharacterized protein B0I36DRAFT_233038 [Microdochium trichocladiopsis]|uniref:BZIP transcription factor n=1 Tax=Microdochium trichocladiopsis TaxID=1682393 RepID=A0A9P9BU11_9PEZI|nr:uncharacterized protein B0I36DRAFT_233038 [Microdochium trichocladiopsis]KAH7040541.1 hypothetical protein B0I36DRAFT_233038 [Microdochium trichocladiopsis]
MRGAGPTSNPHKRDLSQSLEAAQSPDSAVSSPANYGSGHDVGSAGPEEQRSKKRRGAPGSRGVANLTPEQLAKKRANDREAQRAIRERTKNQIETLENRIRELTSQQPYQELQAVIRAKEAVEAENAEIKNRLATIMSIIRPMMGSQEAEGGYPSPIPTSLQTSPTDKQMPAVPPVPPANKPSPAQSAPSPAAADNPWSSNPAALDAPHAGGLPSPHFNQYQLITQQRKHSTNNLDMGSGEHLKLDFLLDSNQRINRMPTGVNGAQDTAAYHHLAMKHDWSAQLHHHQQTQSSSAFTGSSPHSQTSYVYSPAETTGQSPDAPWDGSSGLTIKNSAATCPLDNLLLDFLHERRQRAAEGVPTHEVIGPRYPSVSSLLNPANSVYSHPLSKVFTDILATFPGICTLPEKVAVLYVMFVQMRWSISPTQENYDTLPHFIRPTTKQLTIPHPVWLDHLPFPGMRDKLISDPLPDDLFDNFFIPFTSTISLNWPYEETDVFLQTPDGSEIMINPVFERHMRRGENWTLGDAFDKTFPNLRGTYNLKRSRRRKSTAGQEDGRGVVGDE